MNSFYHFFRTRLPTTRNSPTAFCALLEALSHVAFFFALDSDPLVISQYPIIMEDNGAPPAPREDRGPRIPPAKLSTIEADPTISIFYRPTKSSPLQLLDGRFSRDAAMIFCDRIRRDLMNNNNSKSFTINGGDLTGVKEVLLWIKQCVSEQSIVKYREVSVTYSYHGQSLTIFSVARRRHTRALQVVRQCHHLSNLPGHSSSRSR